MTLDEIKELAHTIGPIFTALGIVALLAMPHVGLAMVKSATVRLEKNPNDARAKLALRVGVFFIQRGSYSDGFAAKLAEHLPAVPRAVFRMALNSLSEVEVPSGVAARVSVEQGASLTVQAEPGSQVTTEPKAGTTAIRKVGPLLCLALVLPLTACVDLATAGSIRDEAYDALAERGPTVERDCVVRAEVDRKVWRALPVGSREREQAAERALAYQRETRCPEAVTAYTALKAATVTLDAALRLAASGQCMGTRSQECSVGAAAMSAATATTSVVGLVKHVEANR